MIDTALHDAVLFDLDGVLTSTASLHAACWKQVFDAALTAWSSTTGIPQPRFDSVVDYARHVDGRTRADGVRTLLRARGIDLPEDAPAGEWSVHAIADRKQQLVEDALARDGVEAFPGSVRCVRHVRAAGLRTAVVSSSANCDAILRGAGIAELFELTVDGRDVARLGLAGKPAPDAFIEGARRLGVAPARAVVVEDALAGVAAGRAGGFALVVGVARSADAAELRSAGADIVVADLEELLQ
jgi:alpha,alpha-trehalose phosphorylase